MTTERYGRKLTAILSADVKGYSRLMGENEEATVRTLTAYRAVMANLIQKHRGRVVDSPGDNVLAEFKSVVDAVRCEPEVKDYTSGVDMLRQKRVTSCHRKSLVIRRNLSVMNLFGRLLSLTSRRFLFKS